MLSPDSMLSHNPSNPVVPSTIDKPAPTTSYLSPWLTPLVYPLGRYGVMPFYFGEIAITGQENLPREGAVILAPTHRSRWDGLLVPYATGRGVSGRDLRFMVSADEVTGIQGWFIRRLGGFPVNTRHPAIASLRHGVEVLQNREALVIFPEGGIFREGLQTLKPGLARMALQAEASQADLNIKIVPIALRYSHPYVPWRTRVRIDIGTPLEVTHYDIKNPKQSAQKLTRDLEDALRKLETQH